MIIFLLFCVSFFTWYGDYYNHRWALLLFILSAGYCYFIGKRTHWSVGTALIIPLLSGVWILKFIYNQYYLVPQIMADHLRIYAGTALVCLLLISSILSSMNSKHREKLEIGLGLVCIVNSLYIIFEHLSGMHWTKAGGMFDNPSLGACFIGFTYPLWLFKDVEFYDRFINSIEKFSMRVFIFIWVAFIPILAIFLTRSSMGLAAIMTSLVVFYFLNFKSLKAKILSFSIITTIGLGGGFWALGKELFDTNLRIQIWTKAMQYWWENPHGLVDKWFGAGLGSWQRFGPSIQINNGITTKTGYFIFMHSDFLQLIFEIGIFGTTGVLILIYQCLTISIQNKQYYLTAAFCAFLVVSLGNVSIHFPVHALAGAVLAICCLKSLPLYKSQ